MKSWIDLRTVLLALVFAVAASLPLAFSSAESREFYFFDVTLTSTDSGFTQLFWDVGRGMNEYDSSSQPLKVEPRPVRYRYMLPMGKITALRFDLTNRHSVMTLTHARIVDRRGKLVREFHVSDFKIGQQIIRFEPQGENLLVETQVDGNDPILDLPLTSPLVLSKGPLVWLYVMAPVLAPVLIVGLLFAISPLVGRLHAKLLPIGAWLAQRPRAALALVGLLAVALQMHPVIFFGRSFVSPNNGSLMLYSDQPTVPGSTESVWRDGMGSDVGAMLFQHLYYPMVQREALLKYGELPLWNRYCLSGEPLLGQGQSMFGDPFNVLTILADGASWAWDVRFAIAHWLFAVGLGACVWRFTRHLGAAALVTFAGGFIGFYTFRVNHPSTFSLCYSPWILWAWIGLTQAGEALGSRASSSDASTKPLAGWLAALVGANWLVMTSGTVKEAYMLMLCLNFSGLVLLALAPANASWRKKLLVLASAAGVAFVLLTAPLWLSFFVTLKHSITGYDQPHANPLPLSMFAGFFDDMFYRETSAAKEEIVAPGANAFFLIGFLWWLAAPRLWRKEPAGAALAIAALLPLALGFGIVPPSVIVKIPFIANIIHVGNTFSCPLIVLIAVLSGFGFRAAFNEAREPGAWRRYAIVLLLASGLAASYFVAARSFQKSLFFRGYTTALAAAIVAIPIAFRWGLRWRRPGPIYVALLLGLPLLLWRHAQYLNTPFNHFAWTPGQRVDNHAASPAVEFVDGLRRDTGRVVGLQHTVFPSYNVALRWESLYGVDALRSLFYQQLVGAFGLERVWIWDRAAPEDAMATQLPAYDFLNVTHYVTDHREPATKIAGLQLLAQRDLDVFASPTVWPRGFFTDRLFVYGNAEDLVREAQRNRQGPFAAIEAGEDGAPNLPGNLADRIVRPGHHWKLTANTTTFTVDATGPGVVVLTEGYLPDDFQVTVNGKPTPYFRANHSFKGIAIENAGTYEITFAYWPQHFTLALWLGAVGLVLLVGGLVWVARDPGSLIRGSPS
jgi:hypothetical protein